MQATWTSVWWKIDTERVVSAWCQRKTTKGMPPTPGVFLHPSHPQLRARGRKKMPVFSYRVCFCWLYPCELKLDLTSSVFQLNFVCFWLDVWVIVTKNPNGKFDQIFCAIKFIFAWVIRIKSMVVIANSVPKLGSVYTRECLMTSYVWFPCHVAWTMQVYLTWRLKIFCIRFAEFRIWIWNWKRVDGTFCKCIRNVIFTTFCWEVSRNHIINKWEEN